MREIKFRAWDQNNKRFIGRFCIGDDGAFIDMTSGDAGEWAEVKNMTVDRYTGLKAKYGTEVYEGDILRFPAVTTYEETNYNSFEVFWHDNNATPTDVGLVLGRLTTHGNSAGGRGYKLVPENINRMIVIGNIYENPELKESTNE